MPQADVFFKHCILAVPGVLSIAAGRTSGKPRWHQMLLEEFLDFRNRVPAWPRIGGAGTRPSANRAESTSLFRYHGAQAVQLEDRNMFQAALALQCWTCSRLVLSVLWPLFKKTPSKRFKEDTPICQLTNKGLHQSECRWHNSPCEVETNTERVVLSFTQL